MARGAYTAPTPLMRAASSRSTSTTTCSTSRRKAATSAAAAPTGCGATMSTASRPAAATVWVSGATTAQQPRWYLWEGGFMVIAQAGGEVPAHAHHAIQIFLALDGAAAIRTAGGDWREGRGIIVRADVEHSFDARGASGALLFVDPESSEGVWLQAVLKQDVTLAPAGRIENCLAELQAFCERPLESMEVGDLVRHCVQGFCAG